MCNFLVIEHHEDPVFRCCEPGNLVLMLCTLVEFLLESFFERCISGEKAWKIPRTSPEMPCGVRFLARPTKFQRPKPDHSLKTSQTWRPKRVHLSQTFRKIFHLSFNK